MGDPAHERWIVIELSDGIDVRVDDDDNDVICTDVRTETDADLIASAPDHAMFAASLVSGLCRWESFIGSPHSGEVCVGGFRYATKLDEFGVPILSDISRAAIAKARGLAQDIIDGLAPIKDGMRSAQHEEEG